MHTYAHRGMEPKETFIPLGWSSCLYITMYCIFGVSTFKGLLSIPSDGRGARRPLGQSFHESVGPSALPAEKHDKCAAELFHKFKSVAPELVAKLLKSMGLNLETWRSWDDYYGQNSELMVEAFAHP